MQREGPEKTLKNWMDVIPPLQITLALDAGAVALYKQDGTYKDVSSSKRYAAGFKDIATRFLEKQNSER